MFLKAALNGARSPAEHKDLPVAPAELAAAAEAAAFAGADAVHFHVRSAAAIESLSAADVTAALRAVRRHVPGFPIGVSTGAWIVPDAADRLRLVAGWTEVPDFASVNFNESGSIDLARLLLDRGIGVEAGVSDLPDAEALLASGLLACCLRVLLEPQEPALEEALRTVSAIEMCLGTNPVPPRLLHGRNATAWPLLAEAGRRGYGSRIGFEDVLTLPDGRLRTQTRSWFARHARSGPMPTDCRIPRPIR